MIGFLSAFWHNIGMMAPYLLFGFFVAGALSVIVSPASVERHLGGKGVWPVLKATLFGIPLPLCSCGVIPVAASLRKNKASKGAVAAFLLSTPQTGVDSIFVTFSLLGPVFALFRFCASLVSGVTGGLFVNLIDPEKDAEDDVSKEQMEIKGSCCSAEKKDGNRVLRALYYGFVVLPRDIARPMLVGLAAAGVISWLIPADFFAEMLGTGILPKIVMMLLGIPVYVCATASVPVAAALIAKGISPGAALVFLMTGPATNVAALAIIWQMLGRRSALIYIGAIAMLSLVFGVVLDAVFFAEGFSAELRMPKMLPGYVNMTAGVVLMIILLKSAFRFSKRAPVCEHCK